jgi:hypothetical protein
VGYARECMRKGQKPQKGVPIIFIMSSWPRLVHGDGPLPPWRVRDVRFVRAKKGGVRVTEASQ